MRALAQLITLVMALWLPLQGYAAVGLDLCAHEHHDQAAAAHDAHHAAEQDLASTSGLDCSGCDTCSGSSGFAGMTVPGERAPAAAEPPFELPAVFPVALDREDRPPRTPLA